MRVACAVRPSLSTCVLLAEEAPEGLDWVFVSPAGGYGAWAARERTGSLRLGDDVALSDAEGGSFISGAEVASAIVDEIDRPAHHRAHISIAYWRGPRSRARTVSSGP